MGKILRGIRLSLKKYIDRPRSIKTENLIIRGISKLALEESSFFYRYPWLSFIATGFNFFKAGIIHKFSTLLYSNNFLSLVFFILDLYNFKGCIHIPSRGFTIINQTPIADHRDFLPFLAIRINALVSIFAH